MREISSTARDNESAATIGFETERWRPDALLAIDRDKPCLAGDRCPP
jgi:hypothetical protein